MRARKSIFECPVCHSVDKGIKGHKVHDGKQWWSRCHNGESAHGDIAFSDGTIAPWPDPVYFTDDGRADTGRGIVTIMRQVRQ